ncbi:hypothetical protein ACWD0J_10110 [Streptomyces sp. NPDC003011]
MTDPLRTSPTAVARHERPSFRPHARAREHPRGTVRRAAPPHICFIQAADG